MKTRSHLRTRRNKGVPSERHRKDHLGLVVAHNAKNMRCELQIPNIAGTAQADGLFRSGPNTIPFVADGLVTAGSAEYGANFSGGLGSHPAGDIGLSSLTTVTSYGDNTSSGDTTTATYKASASPATQAGSYASTTTYIATATF